MQNPIEQRFFKAHIASGFFALDPFMAEDFLPLGEELFVEEGFFYEILIVISGTHGDNMVV